MSNRISLSLSPTGANPAGTLRVRTEVSPEVVAAHMRQAHRLRTHAIGCLARQLWNWLTRRTAAARRAGECLDGDWLRPQGAR
ncbi:MAG: hypothetical protein L6R19_11735 [Alphaproteobacteria bacterium]|nr:hypothetical protein [Alphaproteobacteria bacterium]